MCITIWKLHSNVINFASFSITYWYFKFAEHGTWTTRCDTLPMSQLLKLWFCSLEERHNLRANALIWFVVCLSLGAHKHQWFCLLICWENEIFDMNDISMCIDSDLESMRVQFNLSWRHVKMHGKFCLPLGSVWNSQKLSNKSSSANFYSICCFDFQTNNKTIPVSMQKCIHILR